MNTKRKARYILNEVDHEMRPITSLCFDMAEKRTLQTASLKDRIRINKELTKSVKLKPRQPQNVGPFSLNEYLCGLPKLDPNVINRDLS